MKCEEKAEEYARRECENRGWCDSFIESESRRLKQAYLAGLAEGKPKWHDLRKNPDDLPTHSGLYCVQNGEVRDFDKEEKSWFTVHIEPCMNRTEDTYMWCKLPKFDEIEKVR